MNNYLNILVAIDVSDEADQVLERAVAMVEYSGAEISVLHVAQPLSYFGELPFYSSPVSLEMLDENAIREVLLPELNKRVDMVAIERNCVDLRFGHSADEIMHKAKSDGVDLIVLGSHGRHGWQLLLGSTANAVLHRAECDVLAVRIAESNAKK